MSRTSVMMRRGAVGLAVVTSLLVGSVDAGTTVARPVPVEPQPTRPTVADRPQPAALQQVFEPSVRRPQQSRRIPRFLIRPDFRFATPTRWCKKHKRLCVRHLVQRFKVRFRRGEMGRTRLPARGTRNYHALRAGYIKVWHDHHINPKQNDDAVEQFNTFFTRDDHCYYSWRTNPTFPAAPKQNFAMYCGGVIPRGDPIYSPGERRNMIECQGMAVGAAGFGGAIGYLLGEELGVGGLSAGATALASYGTAQGGCATQAIMYTFLDWH